MKVHKEYSALIKAKKVAREEVSGLDASVRRLINKEIGMGCCYGNCKCGKACKSSDDFCENHICKDCHNVKNITSSETAEGLTGLNISKSILERAGNIFCRNNKLELTGEILSLAFGKNDSVVFIKLKQKSFTRIETDCSSLTDLNDWLSFEEKQINVIITTDLEIATIRSIDNKELFTGPIKEAKQWCKTNKLLAFTEQVTLLPIEDL